MTSLEKFTTVCAQCNHKIINYQNQFCRKQFLPQTNDNRSSGNSKLDEFIEETQLNTRYCDDFIEWIPYSNFENMKILANSEKSRVYFGTWNLSLNVPSNIKIVLKSINDYNDNILYESKIHHKCRSQCIIPFYGLTKEPIRNEYAMVIRHAEHGDLRNYIQFSNLTWTNRVEILIKLSKALNSLHQMNLLHKDFHCKNILVDEETTIFISDLELCQPIDSDLVSNNIQGVLPYIAPEVLRNKPYTKRSEVYSISMIMWELTSKEPPFSEYYHHDIGLAFAVIDGKRPDIIEGTPDFYSKIMKQCWDPDPLKRPDASLLPTIFEEMMESCKEFNINPGSFEVYTSTTSTQNTLTINSNETRTEQEYVTAQYNYTLEIFKEVNLFKDKILYRTDSNRSIGRRMNYRKNSGDCKQARQTQNNLSINMDDPRYTTQTYNFSLDDLNTIYNKNKK